MESAVKRIYDYSLEEIMGIRFGRYSKSIIQDRALPDVRDGLKPVQRRILYGMYKEKHTYERATVKSARCVGDIMGKYHPHGDSSIYDAMVRMSQWWKQNTPLIDMQGNNGSMDGDGAAAMRYTEAKLSKIAGEIINKDIEKNTVLMAWNFDDTLEEPTVLPAKFPNLLVNGSNGISAGYATNIPPHNLGEIIDATIKRIESPNCRLETILDIVKGPDFPTGGVVLGQKGIIDAFTTGRGKVMVRAKYEIETTKNKQQIVISDIPFDVNKSSMIAKINDIRLDKKIDGIITARDESDKDCSVRIVIELKKDANTDLIINYLLKNTDMQISYNYNMVAIVGKRPVTLGIMAVLDAYIVHQKEILTKRFQFDLAQAKNEMHIMEGLIKALSILDDVIKTIRGSKNKSDAKENLVKEYIFTERQAEAIVVLQLYKLTNTDVTDLITRKEELDLIIKGLEALLSDEEKLKSRMKEELRNVKKMYAVERKSEIRAEMEEIKIDTAHLIPKEDVIVVVTREGYIKRVSTRSYNKDEDTLIKEGDHLTGLYEANTLDTLLLFTDKGNYLYIPVYEIPDLKWKELGKHVSNIVPLDPGENGIISFLISDFEKEQEITIFTKHGMVKKSKLSDFKAVRYSKPIVAIKLKEKDKVISVTDSMGSDIFISTKRGYGLHYEATEIPVTGLKASGVKAISLKEDTVINGHVFDPSFEYITILTSKKTGKRIKLSEFDKSTRARKGLQMIREVKTNPYEVIGTYIVSPKMQIGLKSKEETNIIKTTELPILDRYSVGATISKKDTIESYLVISMNDKNTQIKEDKIEEILEEKIEENQKEKLERIDEKIYTIEDFLDDFKIQ